jgi:hypothetical protein
MNTEPTLPVLPDSEPEPDLFALEEAERAAAYRSLNPLAVISLALGGLSVLTLLSWYVAFIPIAGLLLGFLARRQIRRTPDESAGMGLAIAGMGLSLALWAFGAVVLMVQHANEVPIGYAEISFNLLQPNRDAREVLPSVATDLNEKRVYITGYMYPGRQSIRIKQFLLVPTQGHCKFCSSSIVPTEMINVKFTEDVTADYTTGRVGVGGKLLVDKSPGFQDASGFPYTLVADYIKQ